MHWFLFWFRMKPVMHIGFDFVVRNLPPPTIGYDFDSKCTVSHISALDIYPGYISNCWIYDIDIYPFGILDMLIYPQMDLDIGYFCFIKYPFWQLDIGYGYTSNENLGI